MIINSALRRRLGRLGSMVLVLTLGGACSKNTPNSEKGDPLAEDAEAAADAPAASPGSPEGGERAKPAEPELPDAAGILQKAAQAMGDAEVLANVGSFYYRGTLDMVGYNIHGDLEIWWKGGDFFMEQIIPGIGEMRAGRQGDEIWAEDPFNGRRRLEGVEAEQHAWASSLLLAADWQRYFDTAKTVAERKDEGRTIHDVRLSAASGLTVVMSFDAESGLQVGQAFDQISPMGKQPFEVRFEDYREVDGIKLAFRQVIDTKVQQVVQEITEVKFNVDVDETRFGFPRSGDVVRQPKAG